MAKHTHSPWSFTINFPFRYLPSVNFRIPCFSYQNITTALHIWNPLLKKMTALTPHGFSLYNVVPFLLCVQSVVFTACSLPSIFLFVCGVKTQIIIFLLYVINLYVWLGTNKIHICLGVWSFKNAQKVYI